MARNRKIVSVVNPVAINSSQIVLSMAAEASERDAESISLTDLNGNSLSSRVPTPGNGISTVNGKKVICRVAALMFLYNNENNIVCYYKGDIYDYSFDSGIYSYVFKFQPITKDLLNDNNEILLEAGNPNNCTGCHYMGSGTADGSVGQAYVPANPRARIYVLAKFLDENDEVIPDYKGTLGLTPDIIPEEAMNNLGLSNYIVTNIYEVKNGIEFFEDFSEIVNCTVKVDTTNKSSGDNYQTYTIKNLPVIRHAYTTDNTRITEYLKNLKTKKTEIETSLDILEDQYQIDFKLYNTYGPAHIYYTSDTDGKNTTILDRVNISLTFALKLKNISDDYTAIYITKDIKDAIESMDKLEEYHLENLASDLYQKYKDSLYYIEFRGFNDYDSNMRHFFMDADLAKGDIPPEFINIHTIIDGENVTPDISTPSI